MSNYLSNLAARSINRIRVIQPRPATLFEPRHTATSMAPGRDANDDSLAEPFVAPVGALFSVPQLVQAPAPRPIGHAGLQLPTTTSPDPVGRPSQMPHDAPVDDGHLRHAGTVSAPLAPAPPVERARPAPLFAPHTAQIVQPAAPLMAAVPASEHSDTGHVASTEARPAGTPGAAPQRGAPEPVQPITLRHEASPSRRHSSAAAAVVTQARVHAPAAPAATGPATPTEPAPVIHVTIGRIEVRATPAPASSQKRSTSAPVMGLDEYLKQRNGGGR